MITRSNQRRAALCRVGSIALVEMSASIAVLIVILTLSAGIWQVNSMWHQETALAAERLWAQEVLDDLRRGQQPDPALSLRLRAHGQVGKFQVMAVVLSDGSEVLSLLPRADEANSAEQKLELQP